MPNPILANTAARAVTVPPTPSIAQAIAALGVHLNRSVPAKRSN